MSKGAGDKLTSVIEKVTDRKVRNAMRGGAQTVTAEVFGIDTEGVVWVMLPGADEATPVRSSTVEVSVGDKVRCDVGGGRVTIQGNLSDRGVTLSQFYDLLENADTIRANLGVFKELVADQLKADKAWIGELWVDTLHVKKLIADQAAALTDAVASLMELIDEARKVATNYLSHEENADGYDVVTLGYIGSSAAIQTLDGASATRPDAVAIGHNTIASNLRAIAHGYGTTASGDSSHAEGGGATASGANSHAEGGGATASGAGSHAEGYRTTASGDFSHAEGESTTASGDYSHAEGILATASGFCSHAEGDSAIASGDYSHAEGNNILNTEGAKGDYSHAEGESTTASGAGSHAEGYRTTASGNYSHAEGSATAYGACSHAEGDGAIASGDYSHAEGHNSGAEGFASHAEGSASRAVGQYSHAEGGSHASSTLQHTSGKFNILDEKTDWFEGDGETTSFELSDTPDAILEIGCDGKTITDYTLDGTTVTFHDAPAQGASIGVGYSLGTYAEIVGNGTGDANRSNARTLDWDGNAWHAGEVTATDGNGDAHNLTEKADVNHTHAIADVTGLQSALDGKQAVLEFDDEPTEGSSNPVVSGGVYTALSTKADADDLDDYLPLTGGTLTGPLSVGTRNSRGKIGLLSTVTGNGCTASGDYSHAEGESTTASGDYSHAEGSYTIASGDYSHAEGHQESNNYTTASGDYSHAEGEGSIASGKSSHAEGRRTTASGNFSHAEGVRATASGTDSHAEGYITTASGMFSHVEGHMAKARGLRSHAQNYYTVASSINQTALGRFNIIDENTDSFECDGETTSFTLSATPEAIISITGRNNLYKTVEISDYTLDGDVVTINVKASVLSTLKSIAINYSLGTYAVIVGNGIISSDDSFRSNAFTISWDGDVWGAGEIEDGHGNVLSEVAAAVGSGIHLEYVTEQDGNTYISLVE